MELAFSHQGLHLPRQDGAVDRTDRAVEEAAGLVDDILDGLGTHAGCGLIGAAHRRGEILTDLLCSRKRCLCRRRHAALQNGLVEQAGRTRRDKIEHDGEAAGGFAEHGHIAGIATEGANVLLHPFQSGLLVHRAVVAEVVPFLVEGRMSHVTEHVHAIGDGNNHDIAVDDQLARVIVVGAAIDQAAAMNPDHHRTQTVAR